MDQDLLVGLDVGTSKVCAVVARFSDEGRLEILGVGVAPSKGLRRGVVVNIEAALQSVSEAIEAVELVSGYDVRDLFVGLGGSNIEGLNSRGVVAVLSKNKEITNYDVERVLDAAKTILLPVDREILHVIPQEYIIDGVPHIRNPIDMMGIRLEVEVHIVTASLSSSQNLLRCINRAGYQIEGMALGSYAGSQVVLSNEEKDMGSVFIDIGEGTSDVIVYLDGSPHHSFVLPIGGRRITMDIAQIWRIPEDLAEAVKIETGCTHEIALDPQRDSVFIPHVGTREAHYRSRRELYEIIEPRQTEIFELIRDELLRVGLFGKINGGVILSGGGALLEGCPHLAEKVLGQVARIGYPLGVVGLAEDYIQPQYVTAFGLIAHGLVSRSSATVSGGRRKKKKKTMTGTSSSRGGLKSFFGAFLRWLQDLF